MNHLAGLGKASKLIFTTYTHTTLDLHSKHHNITKIDINNTSYKHITIVQTICIIIDYRTCCSSDQFNQHPFLAHYNSTSNNINNSSNLSSSIHINPKHPDNQISYSCINNYGYLVSLQQARK